MAVRIGGPDVFTLISNGLLVSRLSADVVKLGENSADGVTGTYSAGETDNIFWLEDVPVEIS